ncbi:MAG: metallophosphoesterase [Lachnospiraceae bacterium]
MVVFVRYLTGFQRPEDAQQTTAPLLPSEEGSEPESPAATPENVDPESAAETDIAWEDAYHYWYYEAPKEEEEEEEEPEPEEIPYEPPRLMLASDLHYMSETTHDDGKAFQKMEAEDDGKINRYSDIMIDTLLDEALRTAPTALVLPGDITLNGETENHIRLAEKLARVQEAGIQVLVIPGNHDINNKYHAATYFGDLKEQAEYIETAEEFAEIYHAYGYDQAINRDEASLSYVYPLDEFHWIIMIDSCQYEDYNHVNGRLKPATLAWLEVHLQVAKEHGITVLPVAHHNLLSQSRLYTTECTLENNQDVIALLEEYEVPLYFSGHLHAQRIKKHKSEPGVPDDAYGITEIVLSPYPLAPNQYGCLAWDLDGNMTFETRQADVEAYARSIGSEDENLLNFHTFGVNFLKQVIMGQVMETIDSIPDYLKEEMAQLYADLYFDYCAGNRMSWDVVKATRSYQVWQRVSPNSKYVAEMGQMIEDVKKDLHDWEWEQPGPGETREEIEDETTDDRIDSAL